MDAKTFFKEIKNTPRSAYYLHGEEEYLKDRALEELKALCGDPALGVSDLINPSAREIIEACETLPFFCDRRAVVVRELKTPQEKDAKTIAAYLSDIPQTTMLVLFERGSADKRKALFKAFAAIGADGTPYTFTASKGAFFHSLMQWKENQTHVLDTELLYSLTADAM